MIRRTSAETELDALNLLRDGTEDTFFESIELVEASPRADLAQSDKDASHRLEVERLVAAEDEDEATQLDSEGLDGLGFSWNQLSSVDELETREKGGRTCSSRTEGRTSKTPVESLSEGEVASIRKGSLD
jgi:hypothetical protein